MALNQSVSVRKKIVEGLKLQELVDEVPQKIASSIVPVFNVNDEDYISFSLGANRFSSGSTSVTVPNNGKRVFLTGVQADYIKDALCSIGTGLLGVSVVAIGKGGTTIYNFSVITLTLQSGNMIINFPIPFEVEQGSTVTFTGSYGAGAMSKSISCQGFEREIHKNA